MEEYIVQLITPIEFEGKKYTEIDLSGIADLDTRVLIDAGKYLDKSGDFSIMKEFETEFYLYLASRAADLPIELFYKLKLRDGNAVKNKVRNFLSSRD